METKFNDDGVAIARAGGCVVFGAKPNRDGTGHREPLVTLERAEALRMRVSISLTLDEAREVGRMLVAMADATGVEDDDS